MIGLKTSSSITCLLIYIWAIYELIWPENKCDRCEVSFISPNYTPIPLLFPLIYPSYYRLYRYNDFPEVSRNHACNDAILFIHGNNQNGMEMYLFLGNAGSYKQIRSLGSTFQTIFPDECLTFYTADFGDGKSDGEHSALIGDSFNRQLKWINEEIIPWIIKEHPRKLTIIGHSMGGVLGRMIKNENCQNDKNERMKNDFNSNKQNAHGHETNENDHEIYEKDGKIYEKDAHDDDCNKRIKTIEIASPQNDLILFFDSTIKNILFKSNSNQKEGNGENGKKIVISPGKSILSISQ